MSASTKQKHVFLEALNSLPLPTENQSIVKVKGPRGNNLHEVEAPNGDIYIVSMPVKFRKSVWTKRGDFLIVETINEGDKVKAEIINILVKEQIRHIKSQGLWPTEFENKDDTNENKSYIDKDMMPSSSEEEDEVDSENNDDEINNNIVNNPNKMNR